MNIYFTLHRYLTQTASPHSFPDAFLKKIFTKRHGQGRIIPCRDYTVPSSPGSGAGKGGGGGGSVRESGGALGQYGAAHEEEFFYHQQREQLERIKKKIKKEEAKPPEIPRKE